MLMGHLLCGVLFGALVCGACGLLGLSLWSVILSFIVGANLGLGASATAPDP